MTVYLLSALVLPCRDDYFVFEGTRVGVEQVKETLRDGFVSAVGHESTAKVLTELLGMKIPANRITVDMKPGDVAIAVQFLKRLPEGKVLNESELLKLFKEGVIEFRKLRRVR